MLNRMGALISGIASNLLVIDGVERLHGTTHTLLPDMIEVGSFIGMAAMTRSEVTIRDVSFENPGHHTGPVRPYGHTVRAAGRRHLHSRATTTTK